MTAFTHSAVRATKILLVIVVDDAAHRRRKSSVGSGAIHTKYRLNLAVRFYPAPRTLPDGRRTGQSDRRTPHSVSSGGSGRGVGKNSEVAAPARSDSRSGSAFGLGRPGDRAIGALAILGSDAIAATRFAYGFGEGRQIILVGARRRVAAFVAHQFPALGSGGGRRVHLAQIPGMRFVDCGQRSDDRGGIGVDVCERRNGRTVATRPAAATQ